MGDHLKKEAPGLFFIDGIDDREIESDHPVLVLLPNIDHIGVIELFLNLFEELAFQRGHFYAFFGGVKPGVFIIKGENKTVKIAGKMEIKGVGTIEKRMGKMVSGKLFSEGRKVKMKLFG